MEEPQYHVLLDGRKVGPYSRRTIVGMRIKGTLGNDHAVLTSQGVQLTVADLVQHRKRENTFHPDRSGTISLVQATFVASLVEADGPGIEFPPFKGEVEARVQSDVLRLAGRYRQGMGWKEDRVKVPMKAIVHARIRGSLVDLGVRAEGGQGLQRVTLELFGNDDAGEFVEWLPDVSPWPAGAPSTAGPNRGMGPLVWGVVVGAVLVVAGVVFWVAMSGRL